MPAALQLETTSDIDELEIIARQTDPHVNGRTHNAWRGKGFRWSISPGIERAKAAHVAKEPFAAKESPVVEKATPVIHIFTGANVTSYTELINAIRSRLGELGIRYQDFDSLADFPSGLTGKVLGPSQAKRLGPEKLLDAVRAASLRIRIEPDEQQLGKMQKQMAENCQPRQANQARMNNRNHLRPSQQLIDRVLTHLANTNGGLALLNGAAKQARSNWARHAHKVRYGKA
jgi:hypothetical protein